MRPIPVPVLILFLIAALYGAAYNGVFLATFIASFFADGMPLALVNRDFANYWVAGLSVLDGQHMDLFTQSIYFDRLKEIFGDDYPIHAWSYPPHLLLFLWPFGLLDYRTALALFELAGVAFFVWAIITFRRQHSTTGSSIWLCSAAGAFSVLAIETAQNGFYTAGLFLLGVALARSRPLCAAVAFALLTTKPQLGVLIPLWLIVERNWVVLLNATVLSLALIAVSGVIFGLDAWMAYLTETLEYQRLVMSNWYGIFLRMMPTVFGAIRTMGFSVDAAYLMQWPVTVLSLLATILALMRENDRLVRVFVVCCGTFLITPYAFNYDMGALVVVSSILLAAPQVSDSNVLRILLAIVAVLPLFVMKLGLLGLPVTPLLLLAALLAVLWRSVGDSVGPTEKESIGPAG